MKIEARIFEAIAVFFIVVGIIYTVATHFYYTGVEWAGASCLFFSAALSILAGTYFRFVARRVEIRPEDYDDAEIEDGAGELGFFSPHSLWPFMMAFSIMIVGFGAAFWNWWVLIGGAVALVITACGLVFEYHWGREKH